MKKDSFFHFKSSTSIKQIISALIFLLLKSNVFAQFPCEAFVNESYNIVSLREYRLDKIDKGYEPGYERDLKKGQFVRIIDIYKDYAIIIYDTDTFTINKKYIQSDCLNKILLNEQKRQENIIKNQLVALAKENKKMLECFKESRKERGIQLFSKPEYTTIDKISSLKNVFSNKRINIPTNEIVELLGYQNDTLYIAYKEEACYSNIKNFISPKTDSLIYVMLVEPEHKIAMEKWKERQAKTIEANKKRKKILISKYGEYAASAIIKGSVYIGMTKEMALEAWGKPQDVNTTTTKYSIREQWVYGDGNYLYFENGKLTAIQN